MSGSSAKRQCYYAFLVNYTEDGIVIYIQRAQEEICAIYSGRNEALIDATLCLAVMTRLDGLDSSSPRHHDRLSLHRHLRHATRGGVSTE